MWMPPEIEAVSEAEVQQIVSALLARAGRGDAEHLLPYMAPSEYRGERKPRKKCTPEEIAQRERSRERGRLAKEARERRRYERRVSLDREQFLDDIWEFINRRPCSAVEVGQRFMIQPEEADWLMSVLVSQGRLRPI